MPGSGVADWAPAPGPLLTRWAKEVAPDQVHPEYPRPQLVRQEWLNLNGLWDYCIRPKDEGRPGIWEGEILVPFPVESALSGVMRRVNENQRLWCRRTFQLPPKWSGKRILLNFGAVDWEARVWVNGRLMGEHRGGYDPFSFDVTAVLKKDDWQEVLVSAWDPTDSGFQPRGKQVGNPNGIWYTPITGIWQTVWLEPMPENFVQSLKIVPDIDAGRVIVTARVAGPERNLKVKVTVLDGRRRISAVKGMIGEPLALPIEKPKLWSPESPFLYGLRVELGAGRARDDRVDSYFGMRKIALGRSADGVTRILLNGQALFQLGPLDQGFWPDGLYTAPTDEALRYDVEKTRELGFNMARKHVKVEPARWYYWCDKLGLLVWQDMPSGDGFPEEGQTEIVRSLESAENYRKELKTVIDANFNSPAIVIWVPFNEGWGQFATRQVADWVKSYDPGRLVICASGWNDIAGAGDIRDVHAYPGPAAPKAESGRALVLGEFGGLGLPVKGHTWQNEKNWGYRSFESSAALTEAYLELIDKLRPLVRDPGLSAAVYTQTTDVEIEINGLLTYDRELVKLDENRIAEANRSLTAAGR
jgi:beta-galactosidase/beta-glucuronidase